MGFNSEKISQTGVDSGLGLPVLTTTERDAIVSPAEGGLVFNSTTNALNVYDGSAWGAVGGGTASDKEVLLASMSAAQTPTAGQHVQFNYKYFQKGTGIVMSTGTGQQLGIFTLPANKTFKIHCKLSGQPDTSTTTYYYVYDETNSAEIRGVRGFSADDVAQSTVVSSMQGCTSYVTTTTPIDISIKMTNAIAFSFIYGFAPDDEQSLITIEEV